MAVLCWPIQKIYFSNVYNHKNNFGIDCEWHFFFPLHEKSPYDGINRAVKRATTKSCWVAKTFKN